MAATEPDRYEIYEMMRQAWGEPLATVMIRRVPLMDLTQLATKQDVDNMAIQLRGEMSELRGEMSELRGEMAELRAEMRGEMAELRAEFRASSRHTMVTIIAAAVSIWLTFYLPQVL